MKFQVLYKNVGGELEHLRENFPKEGILEGIASEKPLSFSEDATINILTTLGLTAVKRIGRDGITIKGLTIEEEPLGDYAPITNVNNTYARRKFYNSNNEQKLVITDEIGFRQAYTFHTGIYGPVYDSQWITLAEEVRDKELKDIKDHILTTEKKYIEILKERIKKRNEKKIKTIIRPLVLELREQMKKLKNW